MTETLGLFGEKNVCPKYTISLAVTPIHSLHVQYPYTSHRGATAQTTDLGIYLFLTFGDKIPFADYMGSGRQQISSS